MLFITVFTLATLVHIISMSSAGGCTLGFGGYLSTSYLMGGGGISTSSGGGVVSAFLSYVLSALLTDTGSYVVLGVLLAIESYALIVMIRKGPKTKKGAKKQFNSSYVNDQTVEIGDLNVEVEGVKEYPIQDVSFESSKPVQKLFVNNPNDFAVKSNRELKKPDNTALKLGTSTGGLNVSTTSQSYVNSYGDDLKKKIEYIKTPAQIDLDKNKSTSYGSTYVSPLNSATYNSGTSVSDYIPKVEREEQVKPQVENTSIPLFEHEGKEENSAEAHAMYFMDKYADALDDVEIEEPIPEQTQSFRRLDEVIEPVQDVVQEEATEEQVFDIPFINEEDEEIVEQVEDTNAVQPEIKEEPPVQSNLIQDRARRILFGDDKEQASEQVQDKTSEPTAFTSRVELDNNGGRVNLENTSRRRSFGFDIGETPQQEVKKVEEKPIEQPKPIEREKPPINRVYHRPPFDLLQTYAQSPDTANENHEERKEIIRKTLEEFHINAIPQDHIQGPTVTRYEIMMPAGISVKRVLGYDNDLRMRLMAKDGVRIEAPIPGKNLVGIEVANNTKVTVGLKEVMDGLAGKKVKPTALMFAVGKDIVGNSISYDLAKGPHYLVAGATGSGKSVALHVMIVSMLMRYSPEDLKLVLIDPKSVEFRKYEHIPHLLVDEVITEPKRALALLQWAYDETNRRNEMFTNCGGFVSNIDDYNTEVANDKIPKLPRIVFVIDELADLMEACKKDLEEKIRKIAAKSRSAGIHLVLATQRPSVDVITGTIKANLPSRIALRVGNLPDSQTILGGGGAEKLLGYGDMLFRDSTMGECERYQGAFISGREITNVVNYIKEKNKAYFDQEIQEYLDNETNPKPEESESYVREDSNDSNAIDEFFLKALWLAVTTKNISISQLQRRYQIGYARAGGLVDKMERLGFVSPNEGSKARRVLLTREEFIQKFGPREEEF